MSDRISVVIPTHNRPDALARLLASVDESEEVDGRTEVVVVDDGSADHAYDRLIAARPEVRWIRQPQSGPAAARNRGWRESTGDVVVFVDDDCVLHLRALAHLSEALGADDVVGATIEPLHRGSLVADFMHAEHLVSHKVAAGEVRWLVTACLAIRRPALELVGGLDEHIARPGGEDVDLSFRLKKAGLRLNVSADAVAYHDHRARVRDLARTYYRHGTGQRRLAEQHPERVTDLARSTKSRLSPAAWAATYRSYRRDEGPATSAAYLGLRAVMMVPWLAGAVRGAVRSGR